MTASVLKSVRIKKEDWDALAEHKIQFDQDFVHRCVLQIVGKNNDEGVETLPVHITDAPSFLFKNSANNEELYYYLREKPMAAVFFFNKYKDNRDFIKELCDTRNPIYLEKVAENLMETFQVTDVKEDIEALRRDRSSVLGQLNDAKKELSDRTKDLELAESRLPELEKNTAAIGFSLR